jgi:hypothetical protein
VAAGRARSVLSTIGWLRRTNIASALISVAMNHTQPGKLCDSCYHIVPCGIISDCRRFQSNNCLKRNLPCSFAEPEDARRAFVGKARLIRFPIPIYPQPAWQSLSMDEQDLLHHLTTIWTVKDGLASAQFVSWIHRIQQYFLSTFLTPLL